MNNTHCNPLSSSARSSAYNPNNLSIFPELLQPVNAPETQQQLGPVVPQHSAGEDAMFPLVMRFFMVWVGLKCFVLIPFSNIDSYSLWSLLLIVSILSMHKEYCRAFNKHNTRVKWSDWITGTTPCRFVVTSFLSVINSYTFLSLFYLTHLWVWESVKMPLQFI